MFLGLHPQILSADRADSDCSGFFVGQWEATVPTDSKFLSVSGEGLAVLGYGLEDGIADVPIPDGILTRFTDVTTTENLFQECEPFPFAFGWSVDLEESEFAIDGGSVASVCYLDSDNRNVGLNVSLSGYFSLDGIQDATNLSD